MLKFVITGYVRNIVMDVIMFSENLLSNLLHGVISLPDMRSYEKWRCHKEMHNNVP